MWNERQVKIKAGVKITTEKEIYHNKPDIVVELSNPNKIYVLEVFIAHLQNLRLQEKIKKARYAINSVTKINNTNYQDIGRDMNLVYQISRLHNKPTELAIMVFGALGEIVNTSEFSNA